MELGSLAAAAWAAKIAFVALMVRGAMLSNLGSRTLAVFAIAGVAVWFGLPLLPNGAACVTPGLALIDIALLLAMTRGGVR